MTDTRSNGRSGPIAAPGAGRHLLVVDDDDRIRELLKKGRILKQHNASEKKMMYD